MHTKEEKQSATHSPLETVKYLAWRERRLRIKLNRQKPNTKAHDEALREFAENGCRLQEAILREATGQNHCPTTKGKSMKAMKCPECGEVSTFTSGWTGRTQYLAPVKVDNGGHVQIDYEHADSGEDNDGCDVDECQCDKCGARVSIDDIEVVDVGEEVPAE